MNTHQWQQFDHHDTLSFKLTDKQQKELIEAWRQSDSFDDVVVEAITNKEYGYE